MLNSGEMVEMEIILPALYEFVEGWETPPIVLLPY